MRSVNYYNKISIMNEPKRSFHYFLMVKYISECRRWLDLCQRHLSDYTGDLDKLNKDLHRYMHNVKGSALTLGLVNTAAPARLAEELLQPGAFSTGFKLSDKERELLLECVGVLRKLVDNYERGRLDEEKLIGGICERLEKAIR